MDSRPISSAIILYRITIIKCTTAIDKHTYNDWYHFNTAIFVVAKHIEQQNCDAIQKCSNSNENVEF